MEAGSSPRMRGTPPLRAYSAKHCGIIPAYAGNTALTSILGKALRDHPRVCGEHMPTGWNDASALGSSPRMRGTHPWRDYQAARAGIIPAYAGNTGLTSNLRPSHRDHPRVCGEHLAETVTTVLKQGSSPRMRGTPMLPAVRQYGMGIIPAYAGNTYACATTCPTIRDHPRVCGEH